MMKFGIITDIHNNVVALDAVLREFDRQHCDRIICAGDIIGIGPYPERTVQHVMSLPNLVAVRGNHEKYLLEDMPSQVPNSEGMGYEEMQHHRWEHGLLTESSIAFLSGLPNRQEFKACGKNFFVLHYGMNSRNIYVPYTPYPSARDLQKMFSVPEQSIVIYGHDHTGTICHSKNRWFINCGSLGCPGADRNIARAAILEITADDRVAVQRIAVPYDASKVLEDMERLKYPAYQEIQRLFFGAGGGRAAP